jgi:ion channel POLLUX/CASTOR
MQAITWRDKLRYKLETLLSKGPIAMILALAAITAFVVIFVALILFVFGVHASSDPGSPELGFIEGAWSSMMHAMDAGNLAGDQGWPLRLLMLFVTLFGIFIVSILIGTLTSGIESKLGELRKGRSRVLEENYTLILGFSAKVYSIISELVIANASEKEGVIVIMGDRDKVEMDDLIRAKISDFGNTRVICRSGNPLDLDDLKVVHPDLARSIIVLAPEHDRADVHVIKSVLALTNFPDRKSDAFHIVAELRDEQNAEAAELVGGKEAVFVRSDELIARITAQTCRQSGLSVVYTELLDFDGAEIYFKHEPELAGKTYKESLFRFEDSTVMGIYRKLENRVEINPPMDAKYGPQDEVIAIAEDNDTLVMSKFGNPAIEESLIRLTPIHAAKPERTLILGWNQRGDTIVRELDNYVAAGSELIVINPTDAPREELLKLASAQKRQKIRFAKGDIATRATLSAIKPENFDHIILLTDQSLPAAEADANTLITLLHLRKISDSLGKRLSIVSEMQDVKNRALAQVARADDFIVSDKMVSLMLAQLSENKALDLVFKQLFENEGSEICLRPVSEYVRTNTPMSYFTLVEAATRKGHTAIGYRKLALADDKSQGFGIKVNPPKREAVMFEERDQVVVLADFG